MAIQFRCPHRPWRVPQDKSRDEKAAARRTLYDVPAGTEWTRVEHTFNRDKTQSKKVNGKVVQVKPYEHELGYTFEAEVTCPACGDTILVSTDQDPAAAAAADEVAEQPSEA